MIKATLSNEILKYITEIDKNRYKVSEVSLPVAVASKLRKNSKKVVLKTPSLMLLAVAEMQRLQMMKKLGSSILHVKSLLILHQTINTKQSAETTSIKGLALLLCLQE